MRKALPYIIAIAVGTAGALALSPSCNNQQRVVHEDRRFGWQDAAKLAEISPQFNGPQNAFNRSVTEDFAPYTRYNPIGKPTDDLSEEDLRKRIHEEFYLLPEKDQEEVITYSRYCGFEPRDPPTEEDTIEMLTIFNNTDLAWKTYQKRMEEMKKR